MSENRINVRAQLYLFCCLVALGADAAPDLGNGESKAGGCLSCHAVDDFVEFEADALATQLTAIIDGETSHMPISQALSEQDVADVAAYLVNAASALGADQARDLDNGERKGRSCLGCHALDNFATYEAAGLATYIRAILAGETGHMRIPATLSDKDIADAAAWLVSANADSGG